MGARHLFILPIVLACLGCAGGAGGPSGVQGQELAVCQGTDREGSRYMVAMALVEDRIESIIYRRSGDLLICEVEAFRRSPPSPRQQSWWVDDGNRSDVFVQRDGRDLAHIRLTWRGPRIEIQMVDYDRAALCGTGRDFLPELTVILDGPKCQ